MVSKSELKQSYKELVRAGKKTEANMLLKQIQVGNFNSTITTTVKSKKSKK